MYSKKTPKNKGFSGLDKGKKPARFNEELSESCSQTIAVSEYLD